MSPAIAILSQISSPTHLAAIRGSASRHPLVMTCETSAATLGPGVAALNGKAFAKTETDTEAGNRSPYPSLLVGEHQVQVLNSRSGCAFAEIIENRGQQDLPVFRVLENV